MPTQELIEVLINQDLQCLCLNCTNVEGCTYRKKTMKIIIQCALYELIQAGENTARSTTSQLSGLCTNCSNAVTCGLPDKQFGAWHCEEYA